MQRRGTKNRYQNAQTLAETKIREVSGRKSRGNALFRVAPETRGLQGLGGGVRSQIRTGLRLDFPANRENNREFCDFGPFGSDISAKSHCAAAVSR